MVAAARARGDAAAIVRPAHTLKSSSASLGAMRLSAICREIEEAGARGLDRTGWSTTSSCARATWDETLAALQPSWGSRR